MLEKGNVFEEKLFLEVLGAGGNDHALARADRGQQVGKSFSGSRTGLDHEVTLLLDRLLDGLRHLQLAAAELVGRMRFRQRAAGRKELVERKSRSRGRRMGRGSHGVSII